MENTLEGQIVYECEPRGGVECLQWNIYTLKKNVQFLIDFFGAFMYNSIRSPHGVHTHTQFALQAYFPLIIRA